MPKMEPIDVTLGWLTPSERYVFAKNGKTITLTYYLYKWLQQDCLETVQGNKNVTKIGIEPKILSQKVARLKRYGWKKVKHIKY